MIFLCKKPLQGKEADNQGLKKIQPLACFFIFNTVQAYLEQDTLFTTGYTSAGLLAKGHDQGSPVSVIAIFYFRKEAGL